MARAKRNSTVIETARQRLNGIKSIATPPDFGPNLKVTDYEQEINAFSAKVDKYNGMLATLDSLQTRLMPTSVICVAKTRGCSPLPKPTTAPTAASTNRLAAHARANASSSTSKKTPSTG